MKKKENISISKKMDELFELAITQWGVVEQTNLAIEEMGELIVAINHNRRNRIPKTSVCEEIADVLIAVLQLREIYGIEKVNDFIKFKLNRLETRLTCKQAKIPNN